MSTRHPRKRSAAESAEALLARDQLSAAPAKRPLSTSLGALFVLFRALVGVLWVASFVLLWRDIADGAELDAESRPWVLWTFIGLGFVNVVLLLVLAWAIWRGSNFARILVMCWLSISIVLSAIEHFAGGEAITIQTTLLTVALDILVLLALSGRDARAWARRPRPS